jgi:hypothetical protein
MRKRILFFKMLFARKHNYLIFLEYPSKYKKIEDMYKALELDIYDSKI